MSNALVPKSRNYPEMKTSMIKTSIKVTLDFKL